MRCSEPQESTAETKYWIGSLKACLYVSINVDLHIILFRLGSNNIFGLVQTAVDGANRYQRPFGVGQTKHSNFKVNFPGLTSGAFSECELRSSEKCPSRLSRESGNPVFLDSGSRSLLRAWPE
jgi:hypothetical protein